MRLKFTVHTPPYIYKWLIAKHKPSASGDGIILTRDTVAGAALDLACTINYKWVHRPRPKPTNGFVEISLYVQSDTKSIEITTYQEQRLNVLLDKAMRNELVFFLRGTLFAGQTITRPYLSNPQDKTGLTHEARYSQALHAYRDQYDITEDDLPFDTMRKWFRDKI